MFFPRIIINQSLTNTVAKSFILEQCQKIGISGHGCFVGDIVYQQTGTEKLIQESTAKNKSY